MSSVSIVNLNIEKGTNFEETFYFTNDNGSVSNLTNTNIYAKLKKHHSSETSYTFTCSVNLSQGSITLTMNPTVTSTLPSGRCVYDVILQDNTGKRRKLVEGDVLVKDSVSI